MTDSRILSDFCKCGQLHHLSRRFHNLTREAKEQVLTDIRNGTEAAKAIRKAKRTVNQ